MNLGIFVERTFSEVSMISPLVQAIRVVVLANLMELSFREFDLILGIGWLVEHQVSLDCVTKMVTLRSEGDLEVIMIGEC